MQSAVSGGVAFAAILLLSAGSYISWRRRHKRNIILKIFIATFTLVALASFLRQVYVQPYDPRLPLAELFLWVQVLHSFDLPRRRDLMLVLVSSLILLSLAGSFALSASFGWIFLPWLAAALAALYFAQKSRLSDLSNSPEKAGPHSASWKKVAVLLVVVMVMVSSAGLAIGAVMPRPALNVLRALPFSLRRAFNPSSGFKFSNPGYPQLPVRPPDTPLAVNPNAYFGFSTFLDLRTRGQMVDRPVMKVRATEPAYWEGMAFDTYNGYSWLSEDGEPDLLHAIDQPFFLQWNPHEPQVADREVVQTYYLESDQPNVIFSAYRPRLLYFPSDYIYQDPSGLKGPFTLSDGVVYSVVSDVVEPQDVDPTSVLEADQELFKPYLSLPELPQRVLDLAAGIKAQGPGPYQRALAIENFLTANYTYSLDVGPLPEGRDAVDYFLFDQPCGYCEHFASAFAVLCRLQGVPSRVITGYSTGDYNPFSGLYEVSLGDAHAWVQVYIRGAGWITMDPTPGFSLPQASSGAGSVWIFGDLVRWMGSRLAALFPPPLLSALKSGLHAAGSFFVSIGRGIAYSARRFLWLPALFALALLLSSYYFLRRRKRRPSAPEDRLDPVSAAMRDFLAALDSMGLKRDPSQTVEEYGNALTSLVPELDIGTELELFERARYGRQHLPGEDTLRVTGGLRDALAVIHGHRGSGRGKPPRGRGGATRARPGPASR